MEQCTTFARLVAAVPDPRCRRGCRFGWSRLLWLIGAALVSGQLTPSAISQGIREHAEDLRAVVGPRLPSDATIRRTLQRVDVTALEACFRQPLSARSTISREARALDGNAVRGAGTHGHPLHLVSEVCHGSGQVIQQQAVEHKSNEIPLVQRLLRGRDLRGLVFTLHNGLTNLLRQAGWSNIAAALRHFGADCRRALRFIGVLC